MSSVIVLTPIVVASWPAIASAVAGAAASMGFSMVAAGEIHVASGIERVEADVANAQVLAASLSRGEKLAIARDGVTVQIAVDARGKCSVCASGKGKTKAQLRQIAEDVSGRIVQQFAYHKLVTELKDRGFRVDSETMTTDQSIQMHVSLGR